MGDIQQQAQMAGLFDGSLSSCEAELQELMRQIDIMVNSKRLEWEASLKSTEAQLKQREEELTSVKMTLDLKSAEVSRLTHELTGMERSQKELVSQYEQQVDVLRKELKLLQKSYEKLQRHHGKQGEGAEKAKEEFGDKLRQARVDLKLAQTKIDDYEVQSREWDVQRRAFKKQVESLETQRQKLAENCQALQEDVAAYKHQLGKRQQLLDQSDLDFKARIVHVEGQLQRAQDTLDGKNSTIQRLEELLEETGQRRRGAEEENRQLLEDTGRKEHRIHILEAEVASLQQELKSTEGALHATRTELRDQEAKFNSSLLAKESMLRSHEDETRKRSIQVSEETSLLRTQLQDSQRKIQLLVESEARLKMEVGRLEEKLDSVQGDNAALNLVLTERTDELRGMENSARMQQVSEKAKRELSDGMEQRLQEDLAGMRQEIEVLTSALGQRNALVETLRMKLSDAEHRLVEDRERSKSELKLANAELEALRVENRSLSGSQLSGHTQTVPVDGHIHQKHTAVDGTYPRGMANNDVQWQWAADGIQSQNVRNVDVDVHVLQSQLQAIQRQLQMAQTKQSQESGLQDGLGPVRQSDSWSRTVQDTSRPGGGATPKTSLRGPGAERPQPSPKGSPARTRPSFGYRSIPAVGGQSPGSTPHPAPSNQTRNLPEGTDDWKDTSADIGSEALHSLETGSIVSGSPLPSPPSSPQPAFRGHRHGDENFGDMDSSSMDISGFSEMGNISGRMTNDRPPSRESVGTRFLREDQAHQAELERILSAHIQDLELKTNATLAKHSQRLGLTDGET
ncbi:centrosomal protein of 63 kDa-like [Diadema antillarum]|uniref:centrosomal protein of 63 kDa-like n=1 Tax=Diadema antillarum TaxID=105358 RepID=UPI003A8AFA8A